MNFQKENIQEMFNMFLYYPLLSPYTPYSFPFFVCFLVLKNQRKKKD